MAKTYRRKHLKNGRVPSVKTLIDNFNYNPFVKLHNNWKFNTDNQKVPNFKSSVSEVNKSFRLETKLQLQGVKTLEDAQKLVLKRVKRGDVRKEVWMYD